MNNINYKTWDNVFSKSNWGRYSSEDLIRFISIYKKKLKKSSRIIEIGFGTGGNFNLFLDKGLIIEGVDFSKIAIKKTKKIFSKEIKKRKIILFQGDISSFKLPKNRYNFLVDNCVTCCLNFTDTKQFYSSIHNSLKKGAKVYLRTFANGCWGDKTGKKLSYNTYLPLSHWAKNLGPQRFTSIKDLKIIFKKKYKIISIEKITRTMNNQKNLIKEWVVHAEKK
ncbi:class I SAM-dependent methyltransferase [Candidatus Pelagibacter sp.]|nr:class I SAM-dependent methyltransferase [Candidatus Pelagibacter sp.]